MLFKLDTKNQLGSLQVLYYRFLNTIIQLGSYCKMIFRHRDYRFQLDSLEDQLLAQNNTTPEDKDLLIEKSEVQVP